MLLLALTVLLLSILFVKFLKVWNFWKNKGIPYVNVFHSFHNYAENALRRNDCTMKLESIYTKYPNSRYIGCYQFFQPVLLVRDPALVRKITVKDFESFTDHNTFVTPEIDRLWTQNLFNMKNGWSQTRSSLSPLFTPNKMRIMLKIIEECGNDLITYLQTQKDKTVIDAYDVMTRSAADVFARTMFGVSCNSHVDRNNEFYVMGHHIAEMENIKGLAFWGYYFCPTLVKFLRVKIFNSTMTNFLRSLIVESIKVRKEKSIIFPDLVHLLMEMNESSLDKNENGTRKRKLSEEEMVAHALLFCFAGFDTVGYVLSRICNALAENQAIQKKLCEEIRQTALNFNDQFTYEALYSMKYLHSVLLESLRLYSPSAILDRKCVKPYLIEAINEDEKPLLLEKDSWVWILHCGIQMDPNYYPNPEKFDPDRFSESNKLEQTPFTFLTFGSGPRKCIAFRFVIMEMKCLIINLLRKYELLTPKSGPKKHNGHAVYVNFNPK